jgi:hypothetical protein
VWDAAWMDRPGVAKRGMSVVQHTSLATLLLMVFATALTPSTLSIACSRRILALLMPVTPAAHLWRQGSEAFVVGISWGRQAPQVQAILTQALSTLFQPLLLGVLLPRQTPPHTTHQTL